MKKILFVWIMQAVGVGALASVSPQIIEDSKQVQFTAIGKPAMLKIHGHGKGPLVQIVLDGKRVSGRFEVDLLSLDTGLSLRDQHMKEKYLEVAKYPKAILELTEFELPTELGAIKESVQEIKFNGFLQLHSSRQPVDGFFSIVPAGDRWNLKATYSLKLSQFNIEIPSYAGIKVADSVEVETQFSIQK